MSMQVFTARVKDGTIVPDPGVELPEGAGVTVIAGEIAPPAELTGEQEAELAESVAEAERGDVISADELLRRLAR